ncbi:MULTISPECIES: molybdopterin-dependent oxidoreductase [Halorussus]|uniref:molybdopterin-dependent oxidoreductase n=1 Tax=Halorussus TaxID=1070314 RepID=UPI00209CE158|nr:molybdopterin-dependent oxidoreductase [Halorussus vallis]USZ76977.1 molybdopterin-dependent oxidoreductase [Halorussus vallis]
MTRDDGRGRPTVGEGVVALAAGVASVAGSYAAAGFTPAFAAAPVSALVVRLTPGAVVAWSIRVLGDLGHQLSFLLALVLTAGLFGVAALVAVELADRAAVPAAPVAAMAGLAVALALTGAAVPGVVAGVAAGVVVGLARLAGGLSDSWTGESGGAGEDDASSSPARRRVLGAVAAALGIGSLGVVLGRRRAPATEAPSASRDSNAEPGTASPDVAGLLSEAESKSLAVDGLEGLVSGNFYQVDINSVNPVVDPDDWTLALTGAVPEQREFDYDDLTGMAAERRFMTLRCVGEGLNGKKMDTALWTGVPVTDLLEWEELPDQCCVMVRAVDDYFEEFPLAALEDALLAYEMNGDPLPRGHGAPVRLLVPGHWGEINVKWVDKIEVLEQEQKGYWEKRGWHGTGPVNTVAKLHAINRPEAGKVQVGGHAYAGTRGIRKVEVSTDGGDSWTEANLSEPLPGNTAERSSTSGQTQSDNDVWRQWEHTYEASDSHEVVVRATDGTGTLQPKKRRQAFPSGPTGWVSRRVEP